MLLIPDKFSLQINMETVILSLIMTIGGGMTGKFGYRGADEAVVQVDHRLGAELIEFVVLLPVEHMLVEIVEIAAVFTPDEPDAGVLDIGGDGLLAVGEGAEEGDHEFPHRITVPPLLVL